MTNLEIFKNEEFGEVRTITIDDEPYFVGKDVALILGYTNPQKALKKYENRILKFTFESIDNILD